MVNERLLKVAIDREPLKVAREMGYDVHRLSPKDIVDKGDYEAGFRFRLSKPVPSQPFPEIVMARSQDEIATFLKGKIGAEKPIVPELVAFEKRLEYELKREGFTREPGNPGNENEIPKVKEAAANILIIGGLLGVCFLLIKAQMK